MIDLMIKESSSGCRKNQGLPELHDGQNHDAMSDEHMVQQIVDGQSSHFALLIERYKNKILALVLGIVGYAHQSDAEDVVQNVFLKTYQKLDRFGFQSKFSTWLYRLAYNTSQDYLRVTASRSKLISGQEISDLDPDPDHRDGLQQQVDREFCQQLERILNGLSETARVAVRCYYWLDKPVTEIAEILNTNENNVKSILFRARKTLKTLLENDHD